MIYFFTATYPEAQPLLFHFAMKSVNNPKFRIFKGLETCLVIGGVGPVKAALAVAHLLTLYPPSPRDLFVNIGICGGNPDRFAKGGLFLCSKLTDSSTNRSYYPDMLFQHPFQEASLVSYPLPVESPGPAQALADMEGAFLFQAVSHYMNRHTLFFFKAVSDHFVVAHMASDYIESLIQPHISPIALWLSQISSVLPQNLPVLDEEEENFLFQIFQNLRLSVASQHRLRQYGKKYKVRNGSVKPILLSYAHIQANSKNEGKDFYQKLINQLLS